MYRYGKFISTWNISYDIVSYNLFIPKDIPRQYEQCIQFDEENTFRYVPDTIHNQL
jgi:hypothetical protein